MSPSPIHTSRLNCLTLCWEPDYCAFVICNSPILSRGGVCRVLPNIWLLESFHPLLHNVSSMAEHSRCLALCMLTVSLCDRCWSITVRNFSAEGDYGNNFWKGICNLGKTFFWMILRNTSFKPGLQKVRSTRATVKWLSVRLNFRPPNESDGITAL